VKDLKNSLLIPEEFLDAKKLRTLKGANQNSSLRSSNSDLLGREEVILVFWLKFPKFFSNYFSNPVVVKGKDSFQKTAP
jgi:hypothetical protein